jgi:dTDP-4-dehydrorhamnose reductase
LIHLSTDCVFSGKKGNYSECDNADAEDLYGRTKLLGEVIEKHCLTLRTSMIGPELHRNNSLLEWFLAQKGTVKGFKRAIFSGFTTFELSRIIERLLVEYPTSHGLYHVSADSISKHDLLSMIKQKMNLSVHIDPDTDFTCNRSLDSSRFRRDFKYIPPSWPDMVDELCERIT